MVVTAAFQTRFPELQCGIRAKLYAAHTLFAVSVPDRTFGFRIDRNIMHRAHFDAGSASVAFVIRPEIFVVFFQIGNGAYRDEFSDKINRENA